MARDEPDVVHFNITHRIYNQDASANQSELLSFDKGDDTAATLSTKTVVSDEP